MPAAGLRRLSDESRAVFCRIFRVHDCVLVPCSWVGVETVESGVVRVESAQLWESLAVCRTRLTASYWGSLPATSMLESESDAVGVLVCVAVAARCGKSKSAGLAVGVLAYPGPSRGMEKWASAREPAAHIQPGGHLPLGFRVAPIFPWRGGEWEAR